MPYIGPFDTRLSVFTIKMLCVIPGKIKHLGKKKAYTVYCSSCSFNLFGWATILFMLSKTVVKCIIPHIFRERIQVKTCMSDNKITLSKLLRQCFDLLDFLFLSGNQSFSGTWGKCGRCCLGQDSVHNTQTTNVTFLNFLNMRERERSRTSKREMFWHQKKRYCIQVIYLRIFWWIHYILIECEKLCLLIIILLIRKDLYLLLAL